MQAGADSEEDISDKGNDEEIESGDDDDEIGFQYVLKGTKSRPRRGQ